MGQSALPKADREPGGGTKTIISLTAAAYAGAPTADRILKQAAVLPQIATQSILAFPTV